MQKRQKLQLQRNKRQPFTLLEICVCLAILSLIGSLVGVKIKEMVGNQQFKNAAERLAIELREAQFMALNYQTDIKMKILVEKGTFFLERSTYEPVKVLSRTHRCTLAGVGKLFFNKKKVATHTFTVYSTGRISPAGELKLVSTQQRASDEDVDAIWLDVRSPLHIKLAAHPLTPQTEHMPDYPSI